MLGSVAGLFVETPRQAGKYERSGQGLASPAAARCQQEANLRPQKGDWLTRICLKPGDGIADAKSAGSSPPSNDWCTVHLSSFCQDWFRNWARLESAGGRNCKAQPPQGLRESSRRARLTHRPKSKNLTLVPAPWKHVPTLQLLSMSWTTYQEVQARWQGHLTAFLPRTLIRREPLVGKSLNPTFLIYKVKTGWCTAGSALEFSPAKLKTVKLIPKGAMTIKRDETEEHEVIHIKVWQSNSCALATSPCEWLI